MMIISLREVFDIVVMTLAVGYIFMDIPVILGRRAMQGFSWERLRLAMLMTAPAIVLHELAHKFVGLAVGLVTEFHAAYFWLFIGVVLKIVQAPVLFFVPGYVSIFCASSPCVVGPLQQALTAVSGPLVNLGLWLGAAYVLKKRHFSYRKTVLLFVTKKINMFLFFFNMLPLPIFDGFKFYYGLYVWILSLL